MAELIAKVSPLWRAQAEAATAATANDNLAASLGRLRPAGLRAISAPPGATWPLYRTRALPARPSEDRRERGCRFR